MNTRRKINSKGQSRMVVELDANLLLNFDKLCDNEGRKIRGYIKILIERELKAKRTEAAND